MARKTTKDRNEELKKEGKRLHFFGLKLRMYPLHSQETYFNRTIGSARFTYNFYLNEKMEVYKETGQSLSYSVFKKAFNQLKDHPYYNFLKEPDKFALESAMENVDDAFERFFKGQNR
ncbi:helix-turn-helix domain-containing protein, partial [Bacillus thermotolerans]